MKTQTTQSSNKFSVIIKFALSLLALLLCTSNIKAQSSTGASSNVTFVGVDTATQGSWQGKYGADGYSIANSNQSLPSYAGFAPLNQSNWTWSASATDPRATQTVNPVGRVASTWYSSSEFTLDVNLTDGKSHQVAVYALDWDDYLGGRSETLQVVDANTNAVLDTRSISAFTNGVYLVWNITGHVHVNITNNTNGNAVISGIFFGTAAAPVAPAITSQPVSQTVTAGQSSTFSVADTGSAPISYQWMKNGAAIAGATGSSYTTPATVSSNSGSQFSVSVSNAAGTVVSSAATLTVATPTLILTPSASSVNFGSVTQSTNNTQTVTLTNTGTGAVTISSTSVSGAGFNASGIPSGTILAPGQAASLTATFSPAGTGTVSGSISVANNATNGAIVIALSGTGTAPVSHSVDLSWSPSTSKVVGYNIYVSTVSGSGYQKLTSSPVPTVSYTDAGLQMAQTRYYVITSVDSNNNESGYSSQVSAIVP